MKNGQKEQMHVIISTRIRTKFACRKTTIENLKRFFSISLLFYF